MIAAYRELLASIVQEKGAPRILDAGCGFGELYESLEQSASENYLGIDVSPHCISECENRFERKPHFAQHDLTVPIDGLFDYIFCLTVLEHINGKFSAVKNLNGALAESGVLYVEVRNAGYLLKRIPPGATQLFKFFGLIESVNDDDEYRDLEMEEWETLFRSAGFAEITACDSIRPFFVEGIMGTIKNMLSAIIRVFFPRKFHYMLGYKLTNGA